MQINIKLLLSGLLMMSGYCLATPQRQLNAKVQDKKALSNNSEQQMQEMQQIEQFLNGVSIEVVRDFFKKKSAMVASCVGIYNEDNAAIEQKIITEVQEYFKQDATVFLEALLKGPNVQEMVSQIKPVIENIVAVETIKWIHIAATSGIKIVILPQERLVG